MTDLLPCPFCGGEAHISVSSDGYGIECANDRCLDMMLDQLPSEAEAITAWNTRTERTCHAELNEGRNAVVCSECGTSMLLEGLEEFTDWVGNVIIKTFKTFPYCPNCGARVLEENDG